MAAIGANWAEIWADNVWDTVWSQEDVQPAVSLVDVELSVTINRTVASTAIINRTVIASTEFSDDA